MRNSNRTKIKCPYCSRAMKEVKDAEENYYCERCSIAFLVVEVRDDKWNPKMLSVIAGQDKFEPIKEEEK